MSGVLRLVALQPLHKARSTSIHISNSYAQRAESIVENLAAMRGRENQEREQKTLDKL